MQEAIKRFVPGRSITNMQRKPLWMTGKVLKSIQKKNTNFGRNGGRVGLLMVISK